MEKDFGWNVGTGRDRFSPERGQSVFGQYWQELHLAPRQRGVADALCGKSSDMLWAARAGAPGSGGGTERPRSGKRSSRKSGYTPQQVTQHQVTGGKFDCCEANGIRILCGDFLI